MPITGRKEACILLGLLALVFLVRARRLDQPILENYVGRQVPTAMVARNLVRGSGFGSPTLDTGPFPSLFLVEPPIAAQLSAWVTSIHGVPLDAAGRLVSAAGTTLAAWGLFALVRRRSGPLTAATALLAFASFPVTLRYGRAFQPDALAMGLTVAGLSCWDGGRSSGRVVGLALLLAGLGQKVSWAFVLVPLLIAARPPHSWRLRLAVLSTLLGALAWYLHAGALLASSSAGSAASGDNAARWLARLVPTSFLQPARYLDAGRDLVYRAFSPLGFVLIVVGVAGWGQVDRLWRVWTLAAAATLLLLFGKLHHDYYWLMMAPPVAAWAAFGLRRIERPASRLSALGLLLALGTYQARKTWETPAEWHDAPALADLIRRETPRDAIVIAPEAVLYLGDRRGCRLEYEAAAARRAVNEWRPSPPYVSDDPAAQVDFYRGFANARYFADLVPEAPDPSRVRLHDRVRAAIGARVVVDRPGRYLLVEFEDAKP